MAQLLYRELSGRVLGACFAVHNGIGPGLLESAYEGALCIELDAQGLSFKRQSAYPVYYREKLAGSYVADLVVEGTIILELKAVQKLTAVMEAQLINYLRIYGLPVGYLVNFAGQRVAWRRFVCGPS